MEGRGKARGGAREPGRKGRAAVLVPSLGACAGARRCARRREGSPSGRCRVGPEGRRSHLRAAAPAASRSRRPRGAPRTLRGWGRGAGGVRARSLRRGGVAPSAPPPARGRVGAVEIGTHRAAGAAAAGWGGRSETLRASAPAGPGGPWRPRGGVGAGGGARRHVGVCGNLGARAAPLRAGARAGTASVPPRPSAGRRPEGQGRDRGRWLGTGPRGAPEVVGNRDRSCGLKTLQGLGVRGTP